MLTVLTPLALAWGLVSQTAPFGPDRLLPGDRLIGPSAGVQSAVDVCEAPWGYFAVWEDERVAVGGTVDPGGQVAVTDILGARLDPQGNVLDEAPIVVSRRPFSQTDPRVAFNGSIFLVVWEGEELTTFYKSRNVSAARVTQQGQVLDAAPIVIDDEEFEDEHPWDVTSDGNQFLVLWQDVTNGIYSLDGALVDAAGNVTNKGPLYSPSNQYLSPWNVTVEYAGGNYMAVWSSWSGGVEGRRWDSALNRLGKKFQIGTSQNTRPDIATDGSDFYVTWGEGGTWGWVRGTPVSATGQVGAFDGTLLTPSSYPTDPKPVAASDGTHWHVLWENWHAANGFSLHQSVVDANGGLVGTPHTVLPPGHWVNAPAAGRGAGRVLAIWEDARATSGTHGGHDLYASFLDAQGGKTADFPVALSAPAQISPDVAFTDDLGLGLVVFTSRTSGRARILAQRVDVFGRALDAEPIELARGNPNLRTPAVAWNGELFLVVWEDFANSVFQSRIHGKRVLRDGSVLDAQPLDLLAGNGPDLEALGDDFLVAASHEPINHQRYIEGVRVDGPTGAVLDANPLFLGQTYGSQVSVTAIDDRWGLAFQRNFTHDNPRANVRVNFVLANGTILGEFVPTTASSSEYQPALAGGDGQFLLLWQNGDDVVGTRLNRDGVAIDNPAGLTVSGAARHQFAPVAAWDGLRWMTAWTDFRAHPFIEPGLGDVYASGFSASGAVLDPSGVPVATGEGAEGDVRLAADRGQALAVWTAHHAEAPFGGMRLTLAARAPQWTTTDLVRGQSATLTIDHAEPGDVAWFLYSRAGRGVGTRVGQLAGLGLDLAPTARIAGNAPANANGTASLTVTVPPNAPLGSVTFQALLQRSPVELAGKSDLATAIVQ